VYNNAKTSIMEVIMGEKAAVGTRGHPSAVRWSQRCEVVTRSTRLLDGFGFPDRWFNDGFGGRKDNGSIASIGRTGLLAAANR
jgi:hypothetical protein